MTVEAEPLVALRVGDAEVVVDAERAAITAITTPTRSYVDPSGAGSILRLAIPLDDYAAHYVECGGARPVVESEGGALRITYDRLRSKHLELDVQVELSFTPTDDGLVLRARVRNDSDRDIPQVVFPQVLGLTPRRDGAPTRLQLPGRRMEPFVELAMPPHDLSFLEVPLQEYIYYGCLDLTMKWLDFGDVDDGFTLYWRSPRYTTQGLLVQRPDRAIERLDLRWAQYPSLGPGQSWDSDEVVLLPHTGDWYAGAEAFRQFVKDRYVYDAPRHVREALAIRSLWPAVRNAPPRFRYRDLPEYAAEVADPSLGVGEVVFWHWWLKNGYPIVLDDRLGTEEELRAALDRCREMGVPISLFVSHHILRDTHETDPDWLHRNKTGQAVVWNWTYSSDYIPKFPVLFAATHSMVKASALSPGWRETGLNEYRRALDLGAESICFDVFYAWGEPNYSASADGEPDEEGERLIEFAREARRIIRERRPEGSFSGEWPSELKVPVMDYTWDWRNAYDVAACAPFRYVFSQFRLNANVGAHPRGPVVAFMEDALLNIMPGGLVTERLADHPELVELLRRLTTLRRRFLPFFTEGRYRHLEGARVEGGDARVFTHDTDVLVVVANPTDVVATVTVSVDLDRLGMPGTDWTVEAHQLDGSVDPRAATGVAYRTTETLGPDGLVVLHLHNPESSP